jgi:CDP-glucose 4,6-dehydratase
VDFNFWRNKRVFITGHTGFKGSWLALWLRNLGASVTGYALPPTSTQTLFNTLGLDTKITSLFGDISDLASVRDAVVSVDPEIIVHMAAQPLVQESFHNPYETFSTNVMGTVNILEAVRFCSSVRAVVVVTTDKCYQNNEWIWPYRENDRLGGDDPYSSSKACAELVTHSFHQSFFEKGSSTLGGVAVATVRAGNVIGGGDWAKNRLLPDLVRSIELGQEITLRNPNATRPWQFVLEPLRGYLVLAQRLFEDGHDFSGGWNFGPSAGEARTVKWVVGAMCNALGVENKWGTDKEQYFPEKQVLCLDISKAENKLQWKPVLSVGEGVGLTADWYSTYFSGENLYDKAQEQILSYESLIRRIAAT